MTITDVFMILAVLCSPFLAVFAQRKIDTYRERHGHKLWVFRTLMATRGQRLALEHVQALNSIDLIFSHREKDKAVVEKWNEYLDYFGQAPQTDDKDYAAKIQVWLDRGDDQLAELLLAMGNTLGFNFDKVKIKRGIYFPKGHGEELNDNYIIRKKLVQILSGKEPFPVSNWDAAFAHSKAA